MLNLNPLQEHDLHSVAVAVKLSSSSSSSSLTWLDWFPQLLINCFCLAAFSLMSSSTWMSIFWSVALARVHTCTCHGVTDARFFPVPCLTRTLTFQGTLCYLNGWILLVRHEANLSLSLSRCSLPSHHQHGHQDATTEGSWLARFNANTPAAYVSRSSQTPWRRGDMAGFSAAEVGIGLFPQQDKLHSFIHSFIHCGNYSSGSYCKYIIRWRVKSDGWASHHRLDCSLIKRGLRYNDGTTSRERSTIALGATGVWPDATVANEIRARERETHLPLSSKSETQQKRLLTFQWPQGNMNCLACICRRCEMMR